jgi:hypothetical protein
VTVGPGFVTMAVTVIVGPGFTVVGPGTDSVAVNVGP